jgi:hypothetical protein
MAVRHRFEQRDVALVLWGVGFGILGQSIYDILSGALDSALPNVPYYGKSVAGVVVALLFIALASWVLRRPPVSTPRDHSADSRS